MSETGLGETPRGATEATAGRGGRRARRGRGAASAVAAPATATRAIPYYEFLDEAALTRVEAQAERLLDRVGVEFRDDPEALEAWRAAGARVDGVRVRLEPGQARALLKTAPTVFTQHARNPARSVTIGGRATVFAPGYGMPFVRCRERGRRYGALDDFERLVKLVYATPWLHHSGGVVCEPCDIPVSHRHLDMVAAHIRLSDKPFLGSITEESRAQDSIDMARIVFGREGFEERCVIMGNVNANSPLMFDKVASQAIRAYCGAGQGVIVAPFILGGAMGPVTTAGALAQALAEGMAAGAYSQLVRPGAPFVLGNFLSSMSLKSGAPTFGMPEPVMSNFAIGQLARRLGVPLRCGGALTASKVADAQAAYESADSLQSTCLGGANYVLHSAGWLEGGLTMGFEKLILDADRLGAMHVLLAGLSTDANGLADAAYDDVAPGGHFLGSGHTLANYESAYYDAACSHSESFEQWADEGSEDAETRAHQRWRDLLAAYEPPALDAEIDGALSEFIARRKRDIPEQWY